MNIHKWLIAGLFGIISGSWAIGQAPGGATAPPAAQAPPAARRFGGLVPGRQRASEDPAQIARGKTLYGVSCTGCHGSDLRGGDMGGPNLLRSQVTLSDHDGELIIPVIEGGRQAGGMPPIPMSPEDAKAVAAYVRSVVATIGNQGRPPSIGKAAPSVLVGDAAAGAAYFAAKCANCHSPTGDLAGIASRIPDAKVLQNLWVGAAGRRRNTSQNAGASARRTVTASVVLPSGEKLDGQLLRIDDFFVTVGLNDGTARTIRREGNIPKVEVVDPMQEHRNLLAVYTDKDLHDVTAYLVTLK